MKNARCEDAGEGRAKNTKYKNRGSGDQNSQTAKVFGTPVGSSALIHAVMDAGDNALSSIPVRSTGPNNTAHPVIHCTPIYSFLRDLVLLASATSLINVIT